jgi:hypothetical protein
VVCGGLVVDCGGLVGALWWVGEFGVCGNVDGVGASAVG